MSANPNLLFYSNQCQMCQSLIRILKNENMVQYFKCICVDIESVRRALPPGINRVPTAIIPSMNKKLVADEIFQWLQSLKMSRLQHSNVQPTIMQQRMQHTQQNNCNGNQPVQQQIQRPGQAGPIGFVSQEMSGLSDTYAYTTVDEVPRHSYVSCAELDKNTIFTAPEKQSKITQSLQPNFIKDAERKRKEQDESINQLFKEQHKNIDFINTKRRETDNVIDKIVENQQQKILGMFDETFK